MPNEYGQSFEKYEAGRVAMEKGDLDRAIELFEESVKIAPHFKTLELLGECKIEIRRPADAIVPLAAAVGLGTNAFRPMYLLAKAYSEMGARKTALSYVEKALQMNPNFRTALELKKFLTAV